MFGHRNIDNDEKRRRKSVSIVNENEKRNRKFVTPLMGVLPNGDKICQCGANWWQPGSWKLHPLWCKFSYMNKYIDTSK